MTEINDGEVSPKKRRRETKEEHGEEGNQRKRRKDTWNVTLFPLPSLFNAEQWEQIHKIKKRNQTFRKRNFKLPRFAKATERYWRKKEEEEELAREKEMGM